MGTSTLMNIFGQILFQNLNRKLSEKKKRILQADVVHEMICKMDDVPSNDSITLVPEVINPYILNNEVYDVSTDSQLKLNFDNDDLAKCSQNKISDVYNNVIYKSYSDVEVDSEKKRIKYKLNAKYTGDYVPPEFFYLNIKTKINHTNGSGNEELDTDSYCVVEDSSDVNNVIFNCYSYFDSIDGGEYELADMFSNYINIPKNDNNSTDINRNYRYSYFKTSGKKSLSTGAIVGIILACVAAVAIIGGVVFCLKNSAKATVYPTQTLNMSTNKAIIPSDSNAPVDFSQKNFNV